MRLIIVLLIIVLLLSGCAEKPTGKVVEQQVVKETSNPMEVFFCPENECREHLLNLLQNANNSIHCAFFDLDIPEIIDTLKQRQINIDVKLVVDGRNSNESSEINHVENSGKGGLMHNKFCIIDGNTVFTGSFNPTENDNFYNNNNIVIVYSKYISDNYENEFQELWNKKFGQGGKVKYPTIYLNDKKIENYFCPEDSCSSHVIENLKEAKTEVYFLAFSFTHDGIGQTLLDLNNKGVRIQGVFEKTRQNEFSEYYNLNNSINVKWDEYKYVMHHKVFIIDNKTVITGSFNPTESADKSNDENVLIIHDEDIAKKYLKEFDQIWNFEENLDTTEKEANSILISEVYYDCTGKDEEEEFVELYNPTSQDVNLDYYFISDGKNNQRLDGIIKTGTTKIIKPKFSLSNKGSYIVLKRGFEQVDFVSWESIWNLEAKTGQSLQRRNFEKVNSIDQWTVGKPNIE